MSREEFLSKLRKNLKRLPEEEIESALSYYAEYLDDAGVENEAAAIAQLGSPYKIASQITAEYAVKDMQTAPSAKKGLATVWIVLLAAFASPIAVPIAFALAMVALALVIVVFSLILSLAAVALSFVVAGLASFIAGFCVLVQNPAISLFYIGSGLFLLGAGVLLSLAVVKLSKKGFNGIATMISKCLPRRNA
jgi:uncharacterized membrane protein